MLNYIPQPIVIREIPAAGIVVAQSGDQADVNGRPTRLVTAAEIVGNSIHYLRAPLRAVMPRLENGEIAAIVLAPVNGKIAQILITAEQWAAGAPERARYAAWLAGVMDDKAERQAKERAYDLVNNEGGEGYNPHRTGSERTYARDASDERDYPEGA